MTYWRQGDVYFESISETPPMKRASRISVLYYGESSGHSHCIRSEQMPQVLPVDGGYFIEAKAPFTVVHDEHGPISFAPGSYRVWQQRVYIGRWKDAPAED